MVTDHFNFQKQKHVLVLVESRCGVYSRAAFDRINLVRM